MKTLPREVKNNFCFIPILPEDAVLTQDDSLLYCESDFGDFNVPFSPFMNETKHGFVK